VDKRQAQRALFGTIVLALASVETTVLLAVAARTAARSAPRAGLAWGLLAAAQACHLLGAVTWSLAGSSNAGQAMPAVVVIAYAAYYPLFIGGLLYLPALAFLEVRAIFPDRLERLGEVVQHSQVLYRELDRSDAPKVAKLLAASRAFDATAGHVILTARQRGWPVLTSDPGRLHRFAPDVDVDLL